MSVKETDTEKLILEAAEAEFLEKGYGKSRTTEIAKRAGLNHAMLHYYYRTKMNLFEVVFRRKAEQMCDGMLFTITQDLPFLEKIKMWVESHFDFVAANERLPIFLFSEIRNEQPLKDLLMQIIKSKMLLLIKNLQEEIDKEVARGSIKQVEANDFLLTMVSLNAFVFISSPLINSVFEITPQSKAQFLAHRKQQNVETVLNLFRL